MGMAEHLVRQCFFQARKDQRPWMISKAYKDEISGVPEDASKNGIHVGEMKIEIEI
jgi:hypothetical protein